MPASQKPLAAIRSADLPLIWSPTVTAKRKSAFREVVANFSELGQNSRRIATEFMTNGRTAAGPTFVNEFWTARQRQASSLHEVSYRACFKPQLPRFVIERLTQPGDVVYDPF